MNDEQYRDITIQLLDYLESERFYVSGCEVEDMNDHDWSVIIDGHLKDIRKLIDIVRGPVV